MIIYPTKEEEKLIRNTKAKKEFTPLKQANKFKYEREKNIVEMYNSHVPVKDIQTKLGVSAGLIYTVLNNHKVSKKNNSSKLLKKIGHILDNPETVKNIITDYQFMSLKDLYRKYGIHKNGLYYILDLYEVDRKSSEKEEILSKVDEIIVE